MRHRSIRRFAFAAFVLALSPFAGAQGSDDCATPTPIAGLGTFPFDNSLATTGPQGQSEAVCSFFGSSAIPNDVWFTWVAPSTDTYRIASCGAIIDTKIAVYSGASCPTGAALACNDDFCQFQSSATFSATAGSSYVFQLGLYPFTTFGGADTFSIATIVLPPEDDCSAALDIGSASGAPIDTTLATTGAQGQTEPHCFIGGSSAIVNDIWLVWTAPTTDTYAFDTCGTFADTRIAVYAGNGCPTAAALACDDDSCAGSGGPSRVTLAVTAGAKYTLQVGGFIGSPGYVGQLHIGVFVPPPPCGTNAGPDLIVGELSDVLNTVPVGGIDAIALGTTSCNIGTALLNWIATTNDHPVIRQNVYRYKLVGGAGRFEQIGMSWLKHGFTSLQHSDCCVCQPGGDGSHLGVGCSDPYVAVLNGNQFSAGPNWQVNAHTGEFLYPPTGPAFSGSVARRCQLALADLELTAASATRFFGEGQYVTKDDAAAGNQNNNVSWRELSVTGTSTDYSLDFTGLTQRQEPALRAWAQAESGVTLANAQVPNDGLLVVGSKATQLAPSLWHYEFAVYNMNSDRSVGTVAIPLPAGGSLSNVETHHVPYHDGDGPGGVNFTAQEWAFVRDGGHVVFTTETQAQNPSANAIRWGTLYNFRFDSSAPPASGDVRLGLWKPGTPSFVDAQAEVPGEGPVHMVCAGDASGAACPCGNTGAFARGCANSRFGAGALLWASGTPSVSNDSFALASSEVTGNTCLFFQGDVLAAPIVFDDGLTCASGSIVRLGMRPTAGFASAYPLAADQPISLRGAIPALGGTYVYQAHYRNTATSFCPPATSNRTNALQVSWSP